MFWIHFIIIRTSKNHTIFIKYKEANAPKTPPDALFINISLSLFIAAYVNSGTLPLIDVFWKSQTSLHNPHSVQSSLFIFGKHNHLHPAPL